MKRIAPYLAALSLALPAHAAAPTLASAEALVRAQYAAEADASPEAAAKLYVTEIAQEMTDPIRGAGEVNLGIDPRYGQTDWMISGLKGRGSGSRPGRQGDGGAARFLDFSKPAQIPVDPGPGGRRALGLAGVGHLRP